MEFHQLIIAQKETQRRFVFNNKINLVASTELSDELLKPNYDLEESTFYIQDQNETALSDLFQIKIRVASTGIVMANFPQDLLSPEQKEELLGEIEQLKDGVAPSEQAQKEKLRKLFDVLIKYSPLFVCYANTGDFIFTRLTFEEILRDKEIFFPVLILLTSLGFADDNSSKAPKKVSKKSAQKDAAKNSNNKFDFKSILVQFKNLDFVFFGVFSLYVSFGILTSIFETQNGESFAIFLIILTVAFTIILNFITYKAAQDENVFSYKLSKLIVPFIYIVVGIGFGILAGFLVTNYLLKVNEEKEINYGLTYALAILISFVISIGSLFTPLITKRIVRTVVKKNKK